MIRRRFLYNKDGGGGTLAAYYPFDGNANEASGSGAPNGVVSGATLTTGKDGLPNTAYSFGSGNSISVANTSLLDFTTAFTIEFYIYPTTTSTQNVMSRWAIGTGGQFLVRYTGGLFVFIPSSAGDGGSNYGSISSGISINTWTKIKIVYDGSGATNADRLKFYFNDVQQTLVFVGTITSSLVTASIPTYFGEWNGTANYLGKLDEIKFYNQVV